MQRLNIQYFFDLINLSFIFIAYFYLIHDYLHYSLNLFKPLLLNIHSFLPSLKNFDTNYLRKKKKKKK